MRTLTFVGVMTTLCWLATSAAAQNYRDTSGDGINPEKAINETRTNTDIQLGVEQGITQGTYRAPAGMPENQGNHWRYRFQNSQWWYYQPNKQWVVWNGKSWVEPQQSHQSGYRGTQGMNQQPAPQVAPMQPQRPAATAPNAGAAKPQGTRPPTIAPTQPATK